MECRGVDLHLVFVANQEVVKGQSLWRHFEMREKIPTQSRKDLSAPVVTDRRGSAFSAWCPEARDRV